MILPDVQPVLALDALLGDARADDLRQPVDVDRIDAQDRLDLLPHRSAPRLGAEDADGNELARGSMPLPLHLLGDRQHVGRRHHDDVGPEIVDQLHLPLGLATDIGITVQPSLSAP